MAKIKKDKVLVQWNSDWADEMDIYGYIVVTKEEADAFKKKAKNTKEPFSVYVGTNEEIDYPDGEALLDELTFQNLTEEECKTIQKFFGDTGGQSQFWDYEEDSWDEDDE